MTDNTAAESELTQRKVAKKEGEEEEEKEKEEGEEGDGSNETRGETESKEAAKEAAKPKTRQDFDADWKYYWYMFRYYHFKVADTIDLYASAACLWVINLYFRLFMGIGPEPPSTLTEE